MQRIYFEKITFVLNMVIHDLYFNKIKILSKGNISTLCCCDVYKCAMFLLGFRV